MEPVKTLDKIAEIFSAIRDYKINWRTVLVTIIAGAFLAMWLPLSMMVLYYFAAADQPMTFVIFLLVLMLPAGVTLWIRPESRKPWLWWVVLALTPLFVVPNLSMATTFFIYTVLLVFSWCAKRPRTKA